MNVLLKGKQQILQELKIAFDGAHSPSIDELEVPPDTSMGDVAFPCFALAKKMKRSPQEIATEIAAKIGPKAYIKSIKSLGPYVNFTFDEKTFGSDVLSEIVDEKESYGFSEVGTEKRVMVEYAQPNTHKSIHVGHLRNFFVGQMVVDVLKSQGYDVVPTSYIGDHGSHISKCLWGIEHLFAGEEPEKEKRTEFLSNAYTQAVQELAKKPEIKGQMDEIFLELDQLKGEHLSLWKKTREWSIDYIKDVFQDLGLTI